MSQIATLPARRAELNQLPAVAVPAELSVVVPTFRERDNIAVLLGKLESALAGIAWEVIFVDDDSPDGTHDTVKAVAAVDPRVRCLHRIGRRGLAGACIEGILSSSAPFVAVMDSDLQHDEAVLPNIDGMQAHQAINEGLAQPARIFGNRGQFGGSRIADHNAATPLHQEKGSADHSRVLAEMKYLRRFREMRMDRAQYTIFACHVVGLGRDRPQRRPAQDILSRPYPQQVHEIGMAVRELLYFNRGAATGDVLT